MEVICKPIPLATLSKSHFEVWPVWSEYYDHEELGEISSWGVSKSQFIDDLKELDLHGGHAVYPLLKMDRLHDRMRVYIKSTITISNGMVFAGYIVNCDFDAFGIFVGEEEFSFNAHLVDEYKMELTRLAITLQTSFNSAKPVSFTTEICLKAIPEISGNLPQI